MKKIQYLLLLIIIVIGFGARLYKIGSPIADWHSWRQADTASVTRLYAQNGLDLLRPRYHDISNIASGFDNPQGWRFVEFPIYNAAHLFLYKLYPKLGIDEWGRLTSILCSLASAFFLFLLGRRAWNAQIGLLAAFFFLILPFNVYFSRVVLPEPMAVMFLCISLWAFVRYVQNQKFLDVLISGIALSLAVLVKPYIIFYGLAFLYLAYTHFKIKGLILNTKLWVFLCIVTAPFFFWRAWMWHDLYLVGIPHWKWAFNGDNIRGKPAFWWWIVEERLGRMILGVWMVLPFTLGLLAKPKGKYPYFVHCLVASQILYALTVATASVRHDYYQTLIIPAVAISLAVGSLALWNAKEFNKQIARLALLGSVVFGAFFSFYQIKENYKINHPEILVAGSAADKLLPKDAVVIAPYLGDTAFLYQTKRRGFPYITYPIPEMINRLGAQYYISLNFDADTNQIMNEYTVLEKTDKYVIVDLTHKKEQTTEKKK